MESDTESSAAVSHFFPTICMTSAWTCLLYVFLGMTAYSVSGCLSFGSIDVYCD